MIDYSGIELVNNIWSLTPIYPVNVFVGPETKELQTPFVSLLDKDFFPHLNFRFNYNEWS
jgi:hypothetical protein